MTTGMADDEWLDVEAALNCWALRKVQVIGGRVRDRSPLRPVFVVSTSS